ncbi:hypothetical protein [Caldimonas sp. KR1-144]|uniref:hypothetical protein n=1 Tax=Caldimonas sp. KR1-144 TaxID=3400911 RepID=UPI003C305DE1
MSRAEVTEELARARAANQIDHAASEVMLPAPVVSSPTRHAGLTRAEVMAEFVRAKAAGELDFAQWEVQLPLPAGRVLSRPLVAEAPRH